MEDQESMKTDLFNPMMSGPEGETLAIGAETVAAGPEMVPAGAETMTIAEDRSDIRFENFREVRAFLEAIGRMTDQITALQIQIRTINEDAASISSPMNYGNGKVQSSIGTEPLFVRAVEKKEAMEKQLVNRLAQIAEKRMQVIKVINRYTTERDNLVLTSLYVSGKKFAEIADELNLSVRQVKRIRDSALEQMVRKSQGRQN